MNKKDIKLMEESYKKVNEGLKTPEGIIAGSEDGAALAGNIMGPNDPKKIRFMQKSVINMLKKIKSSPKIDMWGRVYNATNLGELIQAIQNETDYDTLVKFRKDLG